MIYTIISNERNYSLILPTILKYSGPNYSVWEKRQKWCVCVCSQNSLLALKKLSRKPPETGGLEANAIADCTTLVWLEKTAGGQHRLSVGHILLSEAEKTESHLAPSHNVRKKKEKVKKE